MNDYVVVKQLPDAGVGTIVHWDKNKNCYWYGKSVWVSPHKYNYLSSGSVRQNTEFFAPIDKYRQTKRDPDALGISEKDKSIGNPAEDFKETKDKLESAKKRAKFWEKTAKEYKQEAEKYREYLKNAHALIGRIIHFIEGRVDKINISKFFEEEKW